MNRANLSEAIRAAKHICSENPQPLVYSTCLLRFEAQNDMVARKTTQFPNDQVLYVTMSDVKKTLLRLNVWKAAIPDNIPGHVLRWCADQLADVLTDIFDISLSTPIVLMCFKTTSIILMPKKSPELWRSCWWPKTVQQCTALSTQSYCKHSVTCHMFSVFISSSALFFLTAQCLHILLYSNVFKMSPILCNVSIYPAALVSHYSSCVFQC